MADNSMEIQDRLDEAQADAAPEPAPVLNLQAPTSQTAPAMPPQPSPVINAPAPIPAPVAAPDFFKNLVQANDSDPSATMAMVNAAKQTNPDAAAKALPIAQATNLPLQTVMRNPEAAQRMADPGVDFFAKLVQANPKTADFLNKPENAAVAHDDIQNLRGLEDTAAVPAFFDKAALSFYNRAQTVKYYQGVAGNYLSPGKIPEQDMEDARKNLALSSQISASLTPDFRGHPVGGFAYNALQGTADFAPEMLAAIPTGGASVIGPLAGIAAFGVGGGLGEAGDVLARGGTGAQAAEAGGLAGVVNAAALPLLGPLGAGALEKTPLPAWAVNAIGHGAFPMAAMGAGTSAVDTAFDPKKTWGQFFSELPETAGEGALQGLLFHAAQGGYSMAKDALLTRFDAKYAAAKAAQNTAPIMQQFNDLAANSKVRPRSPEAFNAFMQGATQDGALNNLWIEPDAMKQAGVTPEVLAAALPEQAQNISDAAANNYAVKLSGAEFATRLAGTDIGDALLPHIKTDPNGMSNAEAEAFMKGGGAEQFKAELDKAGASDAQAQDFEKSAKAVEAQIAQRYEATGRFPADVNATTARLGAFYRVIAKDYGISPEEAYKRYGASVTAEGMPTSAQAFNGERSEEPPAAPVPLSETPQPSEPTPEEPQGEDIDHALQVLRNPAPKENQGPKYPIINYLKKLGGIKIGSAAHGDLKDAVSKKAPGLFRNSGKGEIDNIPADELAAHLGAGIEPPTDGHGYVDTNWLREQITNEIAGNPVTAKREAEDRHVDDVGAEMEKLGLDLKTHSDQEIKEKVLAARAKEAKTEAKELGFDLTDAEARDVARLRAKGYDAEDAIDETLERGAITETNEAGQKVNFDEFDIPFPETETAPADGETAGAGNRAGEGDQGSIESSTPSEIGQSDQQSTGNPEPPLLVTREESAAEIARRNADKRLKGKVPQKGLNDLDLFDENGRAIDSQKNLFQAATPKTETPEFKAWFGDSKVVDDKGQPLVVYHGTTNADKIFEKGFKRGWVHLSDSKDVADSYQEWVKGESPDTLPVYVKIENPAYYDAKGQKYTDIGNKVFNATWDAEKAGHDGIIIKNIRDNQDSSVPTEPHNTYVVFKPEQIKSVHNRGTFDANDPRILYQDENNAAYSPTTREIWLGDKANLTSMLHEEGHHFLNVYSQIAAEPDAPQRIKDIAESALKGLKIDGATPEERLANWKAMSLDEQRPYHEQWARGFERYLFRGKAPSMALQTAFDSFRGWLKHVYGSIQAFVRAHPEAGGVNEEIRGVMDRMLATDEEIEYARQVRNFSTLFKTPEEAGMTPDEYKAYQSLNAQSLTEAANELQARSMRDMAMTSRMREESLREFRKDAKAKRKETESEVRQQVLNEPVNRTRQFLKRGEINGEKAAMNHRLDIDALKASYGEGANALWRKLESKFGKYGIIGKGGLHPDDVAGQFGFDTGDEMIRAMIDEPSAKDKITTATDQRMVEKYGDLTDPQTIQRRADQAVHNDARIRFVADELNAARKATGKAKILKDAAKQYAASLVNRQKVGDISPDQYAAAAAKSSRLAEEAMKKGDMAGVAEAKRNQLVNEYAAKHAYDALDDIRKIRQNAKRYDKASIRKKIGTDIDQIDGLLDQYDMRLNAIERADIQKQNLAEWYQSQIDADYEPSISDDIIRRALQPDNKIHYSELTLDQFKGLDSALRSIEATAKARKEIRVNGKKVAVNTAVQDLNERMAKRGEKFTDAELLSRPRKGVDSPFKVALDRAASWLRSSIGGLKPQDFRANMYDLHEVEGPFHEYIFNQIFDRNYWKNERLSEISDAFQEKVKELGAGWQKSLYDKISNKTLVDTNLSKEGALVYRDLTRGDMIGIARHAGNESNFGKLTKGMGWAPEDVWRFLDANMRESDWKAVQAEWDAFEKHWPEIEGMIKRLGGEVPEKVEIRPFKTKFGEMRGGYAPIEYDPLRSKLAARLGETDVRVDKSIGKGEYYKATTTMNSSLKNRNEGYTDIINLDYHHMTRRLHETVHDLAYREAILDAKKIIDHPDFIDQFHRTFGREEYGNLKKFLENVRDMYKRDGAMDDMEKLIQYSRQGIIMTAVGYRLTTVLKHGASAGLKSLGFIEGPGRKYLAARAARMAGGNAGADITEAREKFPEINARLQRMDRDFSAGEHTLYDKETWRNKNNRFGHAMIAWSDALTAIPTAHAAYDWATTEGIPQNLGGSGQPMSHEEAVRFANGVVRQAHGSALETARSNFLHERGMASLLGMIYQFQNNTFGQLADIKDKGLARASYYQSNPNLMGRLAASLVAPAIVGYLVSNGWSKDPWYKQLGMAITGEIASTVPLLRDGWSMVEAMAEGRDWKSSALTLPPVRVAGDFVQAVTDAIKETEGKSTRIIQDAANAIGEVFHIAGLGQAGKTAQYLEDVHTGKQKPQSVPALISGATLGPLFPVRPWVRPTYIIN